MIQIITQNGEWLIDLEDKLYKRKHLDENQELTDCAWEHFYNYEINMEEQSVSLSLTEDGKMVIKSWFYSFEKVNQIDDLANAVGVLKN